jgi:hypothetical protein
MPSKGFFPHSTKWDFSKPNLYSAFTRLAFLVFRSLKIENMLDAIARF